MLTLEKFQEAQKILLPVLWKTDLLYSSFFSAVSGNEVYLKPENMQVTGAYKIRGAYYKINTLPESLQKAGLITSSAGNHAQGVAYAAMMKKIPVTIVMPGTTPVMKVKNTKSFGADVILHGDVYDDAYKYALSLVKEKGYTFIQPFNDPDVAAGQGTIAFEILRELPDTDVILVPMGGGGLAAGVATLAKMLRPDIRVIGVEPKGAACIHDSLQAGKVISLAEVDTIADGVAVKTPGDQVFPYLQKYLDDVILVEDDELIDAFLDVMENHKMIVENAGLLTVAALKHMSFKDKRVVSILSGGNMDVITMSSLVSHGLIRRGRIFTFSVRLPDRPGELHRVAGVLSDARANVIKLDHNQFVCVNRNTAVEMQVTVEAFGHDHMSEILEQLKKNGYTPQIVDPKGNSISL